MLHLRDSAQQGNGYFTRDIFHAKGFKVEKKGQQMQVLQLQDIQHPVIRKGFIVSGQKNKSSNGK